MPIFQRRPTYDPSIDEYGAARDLTNTTLALAGLMQRDQQLALAERGQEANIRQGDEQLALQGRRVAVDESETARRQQLLDEQVRFSEGMAQGADALLGGQPGIQGPPAPAGMQSGYDDNLAIEAVRYTGSQIKNPRARAQFLQFAGNELKSKRVQAATQSAMGEWANTIRAMSLTPGMEEYGGRIEAIAKSVEAMGVEGVEPTVQARVLDEAMAGIGEIEAAAMEAHALNLAVADSDAFFQAQMASLPLGSPMRQRMEFAAFAARRAQNPDDVRRIMSDAFGDSIGYRAPIKMVVDGHEMEVSQEKYLEYSLKSRAIDAAIARYEKTAGVDAPLRPDTVFQYAKSLMASRLNPDGQIKDYKRGPDGKPLLVKEWPWSDPMPQEDWIYPTDAHWEAALNEAHRQLSERMGLPQVGPQPAPQPAQVDGDMSREAFKKLSPEEKERLARGG